MLKSARVLAVLVFALLGIVGCSSGEPTATPVALSLLALEPTEVVVPPTATPAPLSVLAVEATEVVVPPTATSTPLDGVTLEPTEVVDPPTATPAIPTETENLRIIILYDNIIYDLHLRADWGFAALVEYRGHTLLFDTGGNANILMRNMELLGIDPLSIEAVVLSHSHGDHVGGLAGLARSGALPPVYVPPSFRDEFKRELRRRGELVEVEPGQEILPGMLTTGELGAGQIPEQALVIQLEDGIVVVTGCAHPGVVEMVTRAKDLSGGPVRLVLGGFHLADKSASQIRSILAGFRRLGVEQVAPTHCTGERAMELFAASFGDSYVEAGTGRVIEVEPAP